MLLGRFLWTVGWVITIFGLVSYGILSYPALKHLSFVVGLYLVISGWLLKPTSAQS